MSNPFLNAYRLMRAGATLGWRGAGALGDLRGAPASLRRVASWRNRMGGGRDLPAALTTLGPSYIKLGQFLATRDDIVGPALARDLTQLQDRLPAFPQEEAERAVAEALERPVSVAFAEFGPAIAAASIAQVHKAKVKGADGALRDVAVKVLRPGVEKRFQSDLDSFYFAADMIERRHAPSRRLRPRAVVDTLARSVMLEMDLRMEAAAISEMADNVAGDAGFRVPKVDWSRSSRRVLTLDWIDGVPLSDHARLAEAGHDLPLLGQTLLQSFLRHAMRDGFFHADMHQGNLFVAPDGAIVAVDFGIMGRLTPKERRFLAEILHGFITRDFRRVAEVHFEAGYVPPSQSVSEFAQAMRAVGEPLMDRTADDISSMQTRPELILLQKTMVVVEGVARSLDPKLNMWVTAEPVAREWVEQNLGAEGRLQEAALGAAEFGRFMGDAPRMLRQAQAISDSFASMADGGVRLDDATIARIAESQRRLDRPQRAALWVGALSLAAIAVAMLA
jgi:ubiquinone biosynthesis protein